MNRFRITVRGQGVELRGYLDSNLDDPNRALERFAEHMKPNVVMASPAEDDYDPFGEAEDKDLDDLIEEYLETGLFRDSNIPEVNALLAKFRSALLALGAREQAERELHHFEVEQENARLRANLEQERAEHESTLHIGQDYLRTLDAIRVARSNHPECKKHPGDDNMTCGWKAAILDIDKALA